MPAQILIVRHGQSEWNAEGRWQGQADPPLTDLGTRQARAAADALGAFDAIVASDLDRARHTAEIIAAVLGIGPVVLDEDLRERFAGAWQGKTRVEIEAEYPGALAEGRRPDDYESDESVLQRAAGAMARIAGGVGDDGTALVVCHGGVMQRLVAAGRGPTEPIPNLGGIWFTIGPGHFAAGESVTLLDPGASTVPGQI